MDSFGKKRLIDFYLDPTYININHGSYGSCPRVVMDAKRKLQERMDFNTEKWFRKDVEQLLNNTRQFVANLINCKTENLFMVQNATDAYNCLVKSMSWEEGDVIALPNTAYACVRKTTQWLRDHYKIQILNINFVKEDFQSAQKIQLKIQETVNSFPKKIKLAVFDHIISIPAVVCPIESITMFFHELKVPVFIDGAHAVGQLPIDIKQFEVDAYFSNFHKWAFGPKNAAFLYLSDELTKIVRPVLTGNFQGSGIQKQFFWTGTRDFTSYLTVKEGIQYQRSFGDNAVQFHNNQLSILAGEEMAKIWGTDVITKDKNCLCFLNNVIVPSDDIKICSQVANQMLEEDNCAPIIFKFDDTIYCRISCQIYNELSDYKFAATKFLERLKKKQESKKI